MGDFPFRRTNIDLVRSDPNLPKEGQIWINLDENKVKLMVDPIGEPIVLVDFNSAGSGNDLSYNQPFVNSTQVIVVHNLGKIPSIILVDQNGYEFEAEIRHNSINQCTINFINPKTGNVYCN